MVYPKCLRLKNFLANGMLLIILSLLSSHSAGFKLTPISSSIELTKNVTSTKFVVENPSDQMIAIELTMHKRGMLADGSDVLIEDEDNFVVYPSQLILKPNDQRTIKVQWVGETSVDTELPFRLIAEQLPINVNEPSKAEVNVNILIKYVASIYVNPANTKAIVSVASHEYDEDSKTLSLSLKNTGTKHKVTEGLSLELLGNSKQVLHHIAGDDLPLLQGQNILPGVTRTFELYMPIFNDLGEVSKILLKSE